MSIQERMLDGAYRLARPLIEKKWFSAVLALIVLANPAALVPQVIAVYTAPSVEAISVPTWILFALIQIAIMMEAIQKRSFWIFISMFICIFESLSVVIGVLIRG